MKLLATAVLMGGLFVAANVNALPTQLGGAHRPVFTLAADQATATSADAAAAGATATAASSATAAPAAPAPASSN